MGVLGSCVLLFSAFHRSVGQSDSSHPRAWSALAERNAGEARALRNQVGASCPDGSASRCVELGCPDTWVRDEVLPFVPAPTARTAADQWVALYSRDDVLIGVVWRWCPHRGADLLDHAAYHECPGALSCRHAGYSWWIESGSVRTCGDVGAAAPIEIHRVRLRSNGSAYVLIEHAAGSQL
jgi:hypothetical protein